MALRRSSPSGDIESQPEKEDFFAVGQVTVRLPLDWRPLPLLALLLSFIPWGLPLLLLVDALLQKRVSSAFILTAVIVTSLLSEFILKPLIGEPRPSTSACRTDDGKLLPGMPSGHVMICQSLLTFYMLEAVRHHLLSAVIVSLLLMPAMPWARWYNGDHSAKQVALTFIMATVIGLIDYVAFLLFFVDSWASETEKVLLAEVASLPSPSGGRWQPVAVLDCRPSSLPQHCGSSRSHSAVSSIEADPHTRTHTDKPTTRAETCTLSTKL
ncbi:unnamed protein product [Symbiodinium necroappetens]|uniref:Phosphatidic acid phosphatase type 2/haloperoxidase domain-containing protein n=1 Tax=Symbiodinium necroappetens TaxID=1628268 RepID=A0A812MFL8_9DINO|nr:unnamed protein product [Symbiodinium necroappetens]